MHATMATMPRWLALNEVKEELLAGKVQADMRRIADVSRQ
jgi:hypothetical protein